MSWQYSQSSGRLSLDGQTVGAGYSGTREGRNNPDAEALHDVGPVPRGKYSIGPAYDDPHKGPIVMRLAPNDGHDMHGRDGFLIHGDNQVHDASNGCIILAHDLREKIAASKDRIIEIQR